uniref:Uncharacterized protein n=1 Tax=Saccharum spontaneum TaxID=62335 RepID=A0A678T4K7_SACSP|nr:hypothetical protein SS80F19_000002 [Saccharum spontaneum]
MKLSWRRNAGVGGDPVPMAVTSREPWWCGQALAAAALTCTRQDQGHGSDRCWEPESLGQKSAEMIWGVPLVGDESLLDVDLNLLKLENMKAFGDEEQELFLKWQQWRYSEGLKNEMSFM